MLYVRVILERFSVGRDVGPFSPKNQKSDNNSYSLILFFRPEMLRISALPPIAVESSFCDFFI